MHVLVDYDNISQALTRNGPRFVADRIQHQLISSAPTLFNGNLRFDIRFYGGWYTTAAYSPRAIQLMAEIQRQFPMIVQDPTQNRKITLNANLAESLLALPHQTLPHTYRKRSGIPRLICNSPHMLNCKISTCPAGPLNALISSRGCPEAGCTKTLEDFLSRAEQKLVDTMLVSDIIYLANNGSVNLAVVSSDDDLWPGMLSAMHAGTQIFHITTGHPSTSPLYLGTMQSKYKTLTI